MRILGVDPGTATTGFSIINFDLEEHSKTGDGLTLVEFGCIQTLPKDEMPHRLLLIREFLSKVVKNHKPDCIVVESLFFGKNVRTALSVGQARGVIMLVGAEHKLPMFEYTSLQVKLALAKFGHADKEDVEKAVRKFLRVRKLPIPKDQNGKNIWSFRDNAYDAAATAIFHAIKSVEPKKVEVEPKTTGKKKKK